MSRKSKKQTPPEERGYQPPNEVVIQEGWQPSATGKPEGQCPPSGGSNVKPPPTATDKSDR